MVQNDVVGVEVGLFAVSVAGVLGAAGVGSSFEGHGAVVVDCRLAVAGVVDRALSADGQVAAGVDGEGVAGALGGRVVGDGEAVEVDGDGICGRHGEVAGDAACKGICASVLENLLQRLDSCIFTEVEPYHRKRVPCKIPSCQGLADCLLHGILTGSIGHGKLEFFA